VENAELSAQLSMFSNLIEIKGENPFRVSAFRRAADLVAELESPVSELVSQGNLTGIPGIGPAIAAALTELVETGHFSAMDEVLDEVPSTLLTMLDIPGVGPKSVARFYHELGITDLTQLEGAAQRGEIRALKGFGARNEERIIKGIAFLNQRTGRLSIGTAFPATEDMCRRLEEVLRVRVEAAGSVRRMCETVGNLDLVASSQNSEAIADAAHELLYDVIVRDDGVIVGIHGCGVEARIRLSSEESFGTELVRWTGGRTFVDALVQLAGGGLPDASTEEALFKLLELPYIPPELRESPKIIQLARVRAMPQLITVDDIRGDLHLHSDWSDGHGTILEMATAARKRGYEYLSVSDHSGGLGIAHGLNRERLVAQRDEIDRVSEMVPELRLLRASEVEVHPDGTLDFPDEVLAELDLVVASLHSALSRTTAELTARIVKVLQNPHVDIIAHPTGRIIERRPGGTYDWETVFRVAKETGTALEINANPSRLDLSDELAREASAAGVNLVINTDAHDVRSLDLMRYGVAVARRAGVRKSEVINTKSTEALLSWLSR